VGWSMSKVSEPSNVKAIFPDEAKALIDENKMGTYTLLDVRQPFEYEEAHLPGARLIPLPKLADSLEELDRHQPLLVYCAHGGRSKMAARLLSHHQFEDVRYIEGGIGAWEAATASGPVAFHLRFVHGDEPPREVIGIAYQMEEGLRRFHQEVQARTIDADLRELLTQLVRAEESHKRTLLELLETAAKADQKEKDLPVPPSVSDLDLIEGGIDLTAFMRQNERYLQTVAGYLELAMMIEAQALDLYLRMANESSNPITKEVLFCIGDEEKTHLAMLGHYLEKQGQSASE
jgi:sulfur-carrier protein adenylyltransferase/sulfurtransferase